MLNHELNNMKTLILVRHAKSSWSDAGIDDFDRPLNDRGKRDAPEMAKRLIEREIKIDLFVSSPAKRAKKTANFFAEEFNYAPDKIQYIKELYLAGMHDFNSAIKATPSSVNSLILFSHNPGITELANSLSNARVDDMPTCAVFAVTIDTNDWSNFESASKNFLFFDYPKSSLT